MKRKEFIERRTHKRRKMNEKKHNIIYSKILVFVLVFLCCIIFLIVIFIEWKEMKRKERKRKAKKRKRRNDKEDKQTKEKWYEMYITRNKC